MQHFSLLIHTRPHPKEVDTKVYSTAPLPDQLFQSFVKYKERPSWKFVPCVTGSQNQATSIIKAHGLPDVNIFQFQYACIFKYVIYPVRIQDLSLKFSNISNDFNFSSFIRWREKEPFSVLAVLGRKDPLVTPCERCLLLIAQKTLTRGGWVITKYLLLPSGKTRMPV